MWISDTDELHEDEDRIINKKRHRNNDAATKLEAVEWARKYKSIKSAAKKFKVDRKRIKEWAKKEEELKQQVSNTSRGSKTKRLDGGGRQVNNSDLYEELAEWIRKKRENKQPVSHRIISSKAMELFRGTELKISEGWLCSFLKHHSFILRRVTTTAQKPPENYAEAVAKFVVHMEERRKAVKFSQILAMDETAVWFDCPDNRCIDTVGAKDVTIVTTGHEKMRITVCLTASSEGVQHKFVVHMEERRKAVKFSQILAMDETAVWFDCPDNRCIDTVGAKDVTIVTTGHEKMRITVCLTASSEGRKLLPNVLVNRKRPVPAIVKKFEKKLIINWNGSVWMNNETTADYLTKVIKAGGVFSGKRLLVWDAFAAHKSEATLAVLKELGVEAAFIPGGCTKFIQAPDVSWNKPLKERIRQYYTMWMTNDAHKEYTAGGNQNAPALDIVLDWVDRAWQELSKEIIIKSFKAFALSTATDGTEDDQITCFKQTGSIGIKGLDLLHEIRAQNMARDGRNDYEKAVHIEEGKLEEEQPERTEETLDEFNEDGYFMFVEQFGV